MADQIVITEKTSQARDVRAAVGSRFGVILPAEGHLLDLMEPEAAVPAWKRWSPILLRPEGLYGTRPAQGGGKPAKLKAIREALRHAGTVWLATDCDREGQLIGQEILEHYQYRGRVMRVLFTAQDCVTIRDAFANARPNGEYSRLYAAAVARRQADQIYNLSLTRTATVTLGKGARAVIGIGRVKTPTLGIVCQRELEIRAFRPEAYFEVVATAQVAGGRFPMRHAPTERIVKRERALEIVEAAEGFEGALGVRVEDKRQGPPKLHDLPSLQKLCGARFGWSASKTLEVAQELYDGGSKKIITYPRAEVRYLPESLIPDASRIAAGLRAGAALGAFPLPDPLVVRRGASGAFHDKGLEGASHHAVIPNVNMVEKLGDIWPRLSFDEKKLFDVIARAYLACLMPDYRYRQTNVSLDVGGFAFRAAGRQPLDLGWRAAFPDWRPAEEKGDEAGWLPILKNGGIGRLQEAKIEDKETRAPPRYNEGTLVEAMQNAWRFVDDEGLRERLKEAKGIGTPATRADIIGGLKKQAFLAIEGKNVVPTDIGLKLFGVLRQADPALVDPGVTARLECLLDDVMVGKQEMTGAIDAVCEVAQRIIAKLKQGGTLTGATSSGSGSPDRPPTPAMTRYADYLARQRQLRLPPGCETSMAICRAFLNEHAAGRGEDEARKAPTRIRRASPARRQGAVVEGDAGTRPAKPAASKAKSAPARATRRLGVASGTALAATPAKERSASRREAPHSPSASATPLRIPYGNKDIAMKLGARYGSGGWYAPPGVDLSAFRERGWN